MIYRKVEPIGADALIHRLQNRLTELNTIWGLTGANVLDEYPRCYKINGDEGKKTIQYYKGENEYEDVVSADQSKYFFTYDNKAKREKGFTWYESTLDLIFIVDLSKLKPEITHRGDFEVHADVEEIVETMENVSIVSIDETYENALAGIEYKQADDMQPYHVFKFVLAVKYDIHDTRVCS